MQAQQHISKSGHSQIELVLVEQICTNLEINLGKNYLASILSTLHAEDSLSKLVLGSVDALRSLILRYSHRITLSTDCYGAEMASLVVTNAIWQQQQQQQQQQCVQTQKEKLHVSEHNGQSHEEFTITNDLWYYADDEGNIHGPCAGQEMRQLLEVGYFSSDLFISQSPNGQFYAISTLFPDLSVAFQFKMKSPRDYIVEAAAAKEKDEIQRNEAIVRSKAKAEGHADSSSSLDKKNLHQWDGHGLMVASGSKNVRPQSIANSRVKDNFIDDKARRSVLSNMALLELILEFDGSLAFYHRYYYWIVGYTCPMPNPSSGEIPGSFTSVSEILRNKPGTVTNMFVCKSWMSMVAGKDGWDYLKSRSKKFVEEEKKIASEAKDDISLSWTARLCAMAIADDDDALKEAFKNENDTSCGIGAAVKEQWHRVVEDTYSDGEEEFYEEYNDCFEPVPPKHPFYPYCFTNCFEDICEWSESRSEAFATSIAYAAALTGSTKALKYLDSVAGDNLWRTHFDQKGDGFMMSLVVYACANPWLDEPVASIRAILPGRNNFKYRGDESCLHGRHRGGNGNHLHLAAARGHKNLVEALLEGGMNPSSRCTRICSRRNPMTDERIEDARDKGVKKLALPGDWAKIRGHDEVAELLCGPNTGHRGGGVQIPGNLNGDYKVGKLTTFFPNSDRQYGFITPGGIFVHLSSLQRSTVDGNGYPSPNQKLCFKTAQDNRGRKKVVGTILSGEDFGTLVLPLDSHTAAENWYHYKQYGSYYEESDDDSLDYEQDRSDYEESDDDCHDYDCYY